MLAKAVAKDSGSRMLDIQASDVWVASWPWGRCHVLTDPFIVATRCMLDKARRMSRYTKDTHTHTQEGKDTHLRLLFFFVLLGNFLARKKAVSLCHLYRWGGQSAEPAWIWPCGKIAQGNHQPVHGRVGWPFEPQPGHHCHGSHQPALWSGRRCSATHASSYSR